VRRRAALLTAVVATAAVVLAASPAGAASFTFERCNRTWSPRTGELPSTTQGPLTLALSSPDAELTVEHHRLDLSPLADGTHRARFEALFVGSATLDVDLDVSGASSRLQDVVRVPPQRRAVDGRVRLVKGVGEDGAAVYEITPVELPKTVPIAIQSDLGGRLGSLCDGFALLLPVDCRLVRGAFSRLEVPMPEPGETYLLPPECVDEEVAAKLDRYLAAGGG